MPCSGVLHFGKDHKTNNITAKKTSMGTYAKKIFKIVLPSILIAVYFLCGIPSFIGSNVTASAFTHHFFHVNIIHLATNCFVLYAIMGRYALRTETIQLCVAFIIASLSYYVAVVPTIGASDMIYAIVGLRSPSFRSKWWVSHNTLLFLFFMVAYIFVPGISAVTHIFSFVVAVIISVITRLIKENNRLYEKAHKGR